MITKVDERFIAVGLVIACFAFPLGAVWLFVLICAGTALWILTGTTFLTLHYFYRGFRYGEWMENSYE